MKNSVYLKYIALLIVLLWIQCGGHRPLAEKTTPIGFIPFPSENLAPSPEELNHQLIQALHSSGSFQIVPLAQNAAYLNLHELQKFHPQNLKYILTGKFLREMDAVRTGKHVPFLLYLPEKGIQVQLEFRLYDISKSHWKAIETITATATHKSHVQVAEWDPESPDLQLDAKERALLRQQAYRQLFAKLAGKLEKILDIKR